MQLERTNTVRKIPLNRPIIAGSIGSDSGFSNVKRCRSKAESLYWDKFHSAARLSTGHSYSRYRRLSERRLKHILKDSVPKFAILRRLRSVQSLHQGLQTIERSVPFFSVLSELILSVANTSNVLVVPVLKIALEWQRYFKLSQYSEYWFVVVYEG